MSDTDRLDDIRESKRDSLRERLEESGSAEQPSDDGAAAPDSPVHVESAAQFSELLAAHDVVLVDFYADWCGPCQMLEPAVEAVAADTDAAVLKVDIDAHQDLATQYQVRGVPTLLVFAAGEPAERVVGVRDADTLGELVRSHRA
jgi:thioredoxin 1